MYSLEGNHGRKNYRAGHTAAAACDAACKDIRALGPFELRAVDPADKRSRSETALLPV